MQLLIIEGASGQSASLARRLGELGYVVRIDEGQASPIADIATSGLSAIVVDSGVSRDKGAQMVEALRKAGVELPIAIVSAQCGWRERVAAFDAGADDFLEQPLHVQELASRLRALIRRASGNSSNTIAVGGLEIDIKARMATMGGAPLALTRNEFRLLSLFLLDPQRNFTGEEIAQHLYASKACRSGNAIEVHIARLRRKIGHDRIRTVRGVGYRFADSDVAAAPTSQAILPVPNEAWTR